MKPAVAVVLVLTFSLIASISSRAQTGATPQTSADLSREVQELKAEVADLKAQLSQLKPGAAPATSAAAPGAAPANAAVPTTDAAKTTDTAKSTTPTLASLLGPTSLSGFVDVYYGQNFNNPANRANGTRFFDGATNQFGLNMVELVVDKPPDPNNSRMGYHLALGFGQAMNAVNGTDPGGLGFDQYLKEAYFSYLAPVGKGLQVDIGKFVTPAGAEVIDTKDDWNYSRGLLFTYAIPYFHFGARAKYSFSDKYSITGYFVNGWNDVIDNNTGKTYGLSFAWNPTKKFGITQTYLGGPEQLNLSSNWRQLSDTVVTYSPTSKLSLMLNYDYGHDRLLATPLPVHWTGVAGYVKYAINSRYALATRYEYYDDPFAFTTGTAQHLNEFTETVERLFAHHLITRLEFRRDFSNQPVFTKGSTPVLAQNTITAGMVYVFDSREGSK